MRVLAIEVEDHPLDYGRFEGTIPAGQYGAGEVIVWDRGTWRPTGDAAAGFRRGRIDFELDGEKLHGGWRLIRMHAGGRGDRQNWLLMKAPDRYALPRREYDILVERPESVKSGRSISGSSRIRSVLKPSRGFRGNGSPTAHPGNRSSERATWKEPQLATLAESAPDGDDWLHEVKYDGYRLIAVRNGRDVRLFTRNQKDWTSKFPAIAAAIAELPAEQLVLDGEVVVLDDDGVSDFQALQNVMRNAAKGRLYYFVFDLLHRDGANLASLPLERRKAALAEMLSGLAPSSVVRFSEHVRGRGSKIFEQACKRGLEGIISKRAKGAYESTRTRSWLKIKCKTGQEFVVGGFTDPAGARTGLGALLLGYYTPAGKLRYCGRVGTGFDARTLRGLRQTLQKSEQQSTPFENPPRGIDARGVHWVRPDLVANVYYGSMTSDGILRHSSFEGLRADKPARAVVWERPMKRATGSSEAAPPGAPRALKSRRNSASHARSNGSPGASPSAALPLTHPERVLFPDAGITKLDLAQYYQAVADAIMPHVVHRPLMLLRCPAGVGKPCFIQKHPNEPLDGTDSISIREKGKSSKYLVLTGEAGLVSLVQMSVLELHTWGSRAGDLERPDRIIFDLDPGEGVPWSAVRDAAKVVREELKRVRLVSFAKTSGGKGIHVVVPVRPGASWDETKEFSRILAGRIVRAMPDRFVGKMTKSLRKGRIFVDYLRNGRGSTCAAAYSTRARAGAPVSTPVSWNGLDRIDDPGELTIKTVPQRLKRDRDPWVGFQTTRKILSRSLIEKLQE